jgi:hypothetical protein
MSNPQEVLSHRKLDSALRSSGSVRGESAMVVPTGTLTGPPVRHQVDGKRANHRIAPIAGLGRVVANPYIGRRVDPARFSLISSVRVARYTSEAINRAPKASVNAGRPGRTCAPRRAPLALRDADNTLIASQRRLRRAHQGMKRLPRCSTIANVLPTISATSRAFQCFRPRRIV